MSNDFKRFFKDKFFEFQSLLFWTNGKSKTVTQNECETKK